MMFRDRIKELRRVPARDLRPNPKNWRTHPTAQADALRGVLAEIGFADAAIARELPDGSLMLLDGHLRVETAGEAEIPVLVVDVSEEEADKILVTLDPLAAMATTNAERLDDLLQSVQTDSDAVHQMLAATAAAAGIFPIGAEDAAGDDDAEPPGEFKEVDEEIETAHECPKCGYKWS